MMKDYYRTLMRQPNFRYPVGVKVVSPYPTRFMPLPGMSEEQIAWNKGKEAARLGGTNPYPPETQVAQRWDEGYNVGQTDETRRQEIRSEPSDGQLNPAPDSGGAGQADGSGSQG